MKNKWILILATLMVITGLVINFNYYNIMDAGQFSCDYFAVGQFAAGIFAAGTFSVGIFSVGIFSVGIFSLGIFNIGLYTIGIFLIGWKKSKLKVESENPDCAEAS